MSDRRNRRIVREELIEWAETGANWIHGRNRELGDRELKGNVWTREGVVYVGQYQPWVRGRFAGMWEISFQIVRDGRRIVFSRTVTVPYSAIGLARIAGRFVRGELP